MLTDEIPPNQSMGADYYEVLGVKKNATEEQIKKAYRVLAMVSYSQSCNFRASMTECITAYLADLWPETWLFVIEMASGQESG